ncbi:hypothetical protein DIURU_004268 [Diutina rugosa]|uniref:Uncharacterized protein n=1 Tax=Diutina rugosa TaxID=5481 RepID=A0A642UMK0_DIURU|nr:uncharacterized protein DIURU_004268 [Diutina rugosa]KAA8899601.1 hypothetical protein DIURU_004268 [Diutina rugosa]
MKFTSVLATSIIAAVAVADDAAAPAAPPADITEAPAAPEAGEGAGAPPIQFTTWATAYATTLQYKFPDGGSGQAQVYEQQIQGGSGSGTGFANDFAIHPSPFDQFFANFFDWFRNSVGGAIGPATPTLL